MGRAEFARRALRLHRGLCFSRPHQPFASAAENRLYIMESTAGLQLGVPSHQRLSLRARAIRCGRCRRSTEWGRFDLGDAGSCLGRDHRGRLHRGCPAASSLHPPRRRFAKRARRQLLLGHHCDRSSCDRLYGRRGACPDGSCSCPGFLRHGALFLGRRHHRHRGALSGSDERTRCVEAMAGTPGARAPCRSGSFHARPRSRALGCLRGGASR